MPFSRSSSLLALLLLFSVSTTTAFTTTSPVIMARGRKKAATATATTRTQMSITDDDVKSLTKFPKLIVLDLDNTIWTPELYQLRKIQRAGGTPVAGKDVTIMKGAQELIDQMRLAKAGSSDSMFPSSTQFAVASRTKSGEWAQDLLDQFQLRELLDYVEIFPGNKVQHFEHLQRDSRLEYKDMLFFDDARDGKYGNCEPVSALGVLSVHCPAGLDTSDLWKLALIKYQEWNGQPNTIVEWDGSVTNAAAAASSGELQSGTIKTVNVEKNFGFIQVAAGGPRQKRNNDVFFHFSALPDGVSVEQGDQVEFQHQMDPRNPGKFRAANLQLAGNTNGKNQNNNKDTIAMRAFSMNMPFAALLANGYKTLESRNGTMFKPYPAGTQMLLHVGRRTYPDGNRHLEIMSDHLGSDTTKIEALKSLPPGGFDKGQIVAIMELGETYETTEEERSTPEMQRRIAAYGRDSGRIVTEIAKVQYLKKPVPMAAQGGVFKVNNIPQEVIPDDWILPEGTVAPEAYRVNGSNGSNGNSQNAQSSSTTPNKDNKQAVYSISG